MRREKQIVKTTKKPGQKIDSADQKSPEQGSYVFESKQWRIANSLRGSMDAVEYKHVVLGLVFLKYISDSFIEQYQKIKSSKRGKPEDRDKYESENIFWVPKDARWSNIMSKARQPTAGKAVDDAMSRIEKENPALKDALPKIYGRLRIERTVLGQLVDIVSNMSIGDKESRSQDVLGRIYEYFLSQFASSEGKKGGEFHTPASVVRLLVEMIKPYNGEVYDPCCGSAGMLVQSKEFVQRHATGSGNGGKARGIIRVFGQESNHATWRLAKMNLAIRRIGGKIEHGDSFRNDLHPDLKADFILSNPPFNVKTWGGEQLQEDKRWKYGIPPAGNANFAWVQHMIHHLSPKGTAGFVLANGSMSSTSSGEGDIRRNIIEANLVDCMVALPGQLFYSTQIPACLWFLSKSRKKQEKKVLFIDARSMGRMENHTHRILDEVDVQKITDTYHAWQIKKGYKDIPGFCKSAGIKEIQEHGYILTPGRYVGSAPQEEEEDKPFEQKMKRLTAELIKMQSESQKLDKTIIANMESLGFVDKRNSA